MKFNKKGATILVDLFVYLMFVIIVIIFWIIAIAMQNKIERQLEKDEIVDITQTNMLLFFREIQGYNTMAEIIIEAQYDDQKRNTLEGIINSRFTELYDKSWHIDIFYSNSNKPLSLGYSFSGQQSMMSLAASGSQGTMWVEGNRLISTFILPAYNNENIEIKLDTWDLTLESLYNQ